MKKVVVCVCLTAFLFGTMEVALKTGGGNMDSVQLTFLRFMIGGLMNLSAKCNRPDMVKRGRDILNTILVSYIITFALGLLVRFGAYTSAFGEGVIKWLSGLSALFTVFIYVLELIYLAKAKKMLAEN